LLALYLIFLFQLLFADCMRNFAVYVRLFFSEFLAVHNLCVVYGLNFFSDDFIIISNIRFFYSF